MFTTAQRAQLRDSILAAARADQRIAAAAITGSAASASEDKWSDIDLAFAVATPEDFPAVLADFTGQMYDFHQALDHLDIQAGPWLYRVFLLPGTLQVDLAFVPANEFRALAATFQLVFGRANDPVDPLPPSPDFLIRMGWLYALHVRSSMARNKVWQAEYMISAMRDQALALACIRHNLSPVHGRGLDALPLEVTTLFEPTLIRQLSAPELSRAFAQVTERLLHEASLANPQLEQRLRQPLLDLASPLEGA